MNIELAMIQGGLTSQLLPYDIICITF